MNALQAGVTEIDGELTDPDTGLAAIKGVIGSDGDTAAEGTIHGKLQALQESLAIPNPSTAEPTGTLDDIRRILSGAPEDSEDTGLVGEIGAIKNTLSNPSTGLWIQLLNIRYALDGNAKPLSTPDLAKRIIDLETTMTAMYAMREVDKILEGVQLPSGAEADIRRQYLHIVQRHSITNPVNMSAFSRGWTHWHRGQCRAPIRRRNSQTSDQPYEYITTSVAILIAHQGEASPEDSHWEIVGQEGSRRVCGRHSELPPVEHPHQIFSGLDYYLTQEESLSSMALLAVIDSTHIPPHPTDEEAVALMAELGLPAYTGDPSDTEAKGAYMERAHLIALVNRYARMVYDGTVDEGVNYWYMLYRSNDAPLDPYYE
jgi:hypothetical protein